MFPSGTTRDPTRRRALGEDHARMVSQLHQLVSRTLGSGPKASLGPRFSSVAVRGYAGSHQTVTTYPACRPRRDQVVVSQAPGSATLPSYPLRCVDARRQRRDFRGHLAVDVRHDHSGPSNPRGMVNMLERERLATRSRPRLPDRALQPGCLAALVDGNFREDDAVSWAVAIPTPMP